MSRQPRINRNVLYVPHWLDGIALMDIAFCGQPFGTHSHAGFAIGAIESGVGGYDTRGAREFFPANTLSLMNPEQPHNGFAVDGDVAYKMLYISESAMNRLLPGRKRPGFDDMGPVDRQSWVKRRLQGLAALLANPPDAGRALAVDAMLVDTLDGVMCRYGREQSSQAGCEPAAVAQTRRYLDDLVTTAASGERRLTGDTLTLAHLAARVDLHPNYLLDSFRRHIGLPPYRYWVQRRISAALGELRVGDPAADVAFRLGFYD